MFEAPVHHLTRVTSACIARHVHPKRMIQHLCDCSPLAKPTQLEYIPEIPISAVYGSGLHLGCVEGANPLPVPDVAHAASDAQRAADSAHGEDNERRYQKIVDRHLDHLCKLTAVDDSSGSELPGAAAVQSCVRQIIRGTRGRSLTCLLPSACPLSYA